MNNLQDLTQWVREAAGEVVCSDSKGVIDFLVVPVIWGGEAKQKHRQLVNKLWIEDSLDAAEVLPVAFHHVPISKRESDVSPLAGVVTCLSGYVNRERCYLNALVEYLGGTAEVMVWRLNISSNLLFVFVGKFLQEGQQDQKCSWQHSPGLPTAAGPEV